MFNTMNLVGMWDEIAFGMTKNLIVPESKKKKSVGLVYSL
jgi:hypothetical protein